MKRTAGFSLIELMLALALGVVVTSGIVQLFVGNNQTYTLLTGQSRMQESARYALDFIARSARMSGYFGCDPENDKIYNSLNGVWSGLARNCKKCGFPVDLFIERYKTRSTTIHQPTSVFVESWRRINGDK